MRAALPLVLALLAAACSVDVEGAACTVIGSAAECPGGQVCGTDKTCSARAASCTPCMANAQACRDGAVKTCTAAADGACGSWVVVEGKDCKARDLVCEGGDTPFCRCDDHAGAVYVVDASAGGDPADPAPNGNGSPAACRFRSLKVALAAAAGHGGAATVQLAGALAQYGAATQDSAPIAVPPDVTVTTSDEPGAPGARVVLVEGDVAEGVSLAAGASLKHVTIRNVSAPTAAGVRVVCASGSAATIEDVHVEAGAGAPALATGISLEGECPVVVSGGSVSGAAGAGIHVERAQPAATATIQGAVVDRNGVGVRLSRGDLSLLGTTVRRSQGAGIDAYALTSGLFTMTLTDSIISDNGDTGLLISSAVEVHVERNQICGNRAVSDRGPSGGARRVGGLFAEGSPPALFTFEGNRIHDNEADQVVVTGSGQERWILDGAEPGGPCGPDVNVFSGYAGLVGAGPYGLVAVSSEVSATFNAWLGGRMPSANRDFASIGGLVVVGSPTPSYCPVPPGALLVCPVAP
jgi:hypothetical protein